MVINENNTPVFSNAFRILEDGGNALLDFAYAGKDVQDLTPENVTKVSTVLVEKEMLPVIIDVISNYLKQITEENNK